MLRQGLVSLLLIMAVHAHAALNLELTRGIDSALPIAVVPFNGGSAKPAGANSLTDIIRADLKQSGRFRVVPGEAAATNRQYWQGKGADTIVSGNVVHKSGNQYQVDVSLNEVYEKHNQALLHKQFTVPQSALRPLAHHISDLVYEKLTGDRGIASTRIAYVVVKQQTKKRKQYILEVSDVDGFHPQALLTSKEPIMSPSWSPDGKELAYVSFENHRAGIYVQTVATGKRKMLSSFRGVNGAPAWAPDGKTLAVVLTRDGHPNIYRINRTGQVISALTKGWSISTEPDWNNSGSSLLYTSNRGGSPQIYRLDLASQQATRLTFIGNYNTSASFISDSQFVLLHRHNGRYDVALQDIQSGELTQLTHSGGAQSPSVAPNGKIVLFTNATKQGTVLEMVSTDGHVTLRLPARQGEVREPAWSPFLN